jgi:hypothetical protein
MLVRYISKTGGLSSLCRAGCSCRQITYFGDQGFGADVEIIETARQERTFGLIAWQQKRKALKRIFAPAFGYRGLGAAGLDALHSLHQAIENIRISYRNVVGGQKQLQTGRQPRQFGHGFRVGGKIRFFGEEIDRPGIERVPGE